MTFLSTRSSFFRPVAVAAAVAALAGCSSDSTGPQQLNVPDATINTDVTNDVGAATAGSIDVLNSTEASYGAAASIGGQHIATLSYDLAPSTSTSSISCTGPDAHGWFGCAGTNENGLTVLRALRFWNGTSYALGWSSQTDSVNHRLLVTGTLSPNANRTVWANRADSVTLHVLRGTTTQHAWNGAGVSVDSARVVDNGTGVTRMYRYAALDSLSSLTFTMPRSSHLYPASGSITHNVWAQVVATRGSDSWTKNVLMRFVVTFDGTQTAAMQVGGLTCALDLSTHKVSACH